MYENKIAPTFNANISNAILKLSRDIYSNKKFKIKYKIITFCSNDIEYFKASKVTNFLLNPNYLTIHLLDMLMHISY